MTREQIESVLKWALAKQDKEGTYALPDGGSVTFHVAHAGASLQVQKIESVRFEGDLVQAKSAKQTIAFVISDVFAVSIEGAGGQPARRPAGFG